MIKPTTGRVVWFTPDAGNVQRTDQPWAALVTYVHSDRLVNLAAFDPNGNVVPKTSITLLQDEDGLPVSGMFCQWMPYQVGQAKKHEAETK